MLEASCSHHRVSGQGPCVFCGNLSEEVVVPSARTAGGQGAGFCLENKEGEKRKRTVPAIICKLVNFGLGSAWQLWAVFKAKADTT